MNNTRRIILYLVWLVLGIGLIIFGSLGAIDSFWSGMGAGFVVVGVLRLFQQIRLRKNETYREKMETEITDERNRFIRNKAWAWAGYLFILIAAVATIALRAMDQILLSTFASYAVCLMVVLYWIAYLILRKKY